MLRCDPAPKWQDGPEVSSTSSHVVRYRDIPILSQLALRQFFTPTVFPVVSVVRLR